MLAQNSPSSTYSSWFSIEPWFRVNLKDPMIAKMDKGYLYHGEKDNSGTERYLGRCGARGFLRDSEDFNGRIQQRKSVFPPLRFPGLGGHRPTSRLL